MFHEIEWKTKKQEKKKHTQDNHYTKVHIFKAAQFDECDDQR